MDESIDDGLADDGIFKQPSSLGSGGCRRSRRWRQCRRNRRILTQYAKTDDEGRRVLEVVRESISGFRV